MLRLVITAMLVASCQGPSLSEHVVKEVSLYGLWESKDGFSIEIKDNGQYLVCDGDKCSSKPYFRVSESYVILREFFNLELSKRFINYADIQRSCVEQLCNGPLKDVKVSSTDLEVVDNVSDSDQSRKCGLSECVILGDVEMARGTLYKSGRNGPS